jgi:hypothetical protein
MVCMRRCIALLVLSATVACAAESTGPCSLLVKPMLVARLEHVDHATGCLDSVDSLYANINVLADTFRVCGFDTTKVSVAERKFTTPLPPHC